MIGPTSNPEDSIIWRIEHNQADKETVQFVLKELNIHGRIWRNDDPERLEKYINFLKKADLVQSEIDDRDWNTFINLCRIFPHLKSQETQPQQIPTIKVRMNDQEVIISKNLLFQN